MQIMILGAGQIGESLARNLVSEDNDIILVDLDANRLNEIRSHLDIQTVTGHAANPSTLLEAGIEQTDLLVATTSNDEANMLACLIASKVFQISKTIARIRTADYHKYPDLFKKNLIPIQTVIYPAQAIIQYIIRLIQYPDFHQILSFCEDTLYMVSLEVQDQDWMQGKTVSTLKEQLIGIHADIVTLFHKRKSIGLEDTYLLQTNDKILFILQEKNLHTLLTQLKRHPKQHRRIMIGGGGVLGSALAQALESQYQIKLVDKSPSSVAKNAAILDKALVIEGDICDRELLMSENIEDIDVFCAITTHDETNIMASLQAKYLGAKYAMALVNHENYFDLIEDSVIDTALSPHTITIGHILGKIRHGNMIKVHRLQEEEVEAVELIVEGTEQTSSIIGRPITEIEFPPHCIVAGVVRGKKLHLIKSNLVLAAEDHVILLLLDKKYIHQLEALFTVNLTFMG